MAIGKEIVLTVAAISMFSNFRLTSTGTCESPTSTCTKNSNLGESQLMQTIGAVEMYRSQIEVAKYFELAYIGVSDHPDVAKEVRLTAHSARTHHIMTMGLMKSYRVTAKHIVGTMIPMIFDAVDLQDTDLVRDCFAQIITRTEEMKQEAMDTKHQFFVIHTMVQTNLAQVQTKNKFVSDKQRRLDIEKDEAQKLAAENERAAKELEEEKDNMENELDKLKAHRDNLMKTADTASKAMNEDEETAGFVMRAVNIFSSFFGGNKKEKQYRAMMQAYQQSQDNVDRVPAQKREVLFKTQDQKRAQLERLSKIKTLNFEKANLGDAKSLQEVSTSLGEVDRQLSKIISFWHELALTLKALKDETQAGEVYLQKLENPKYAERFKASITNAEDGWNFFGKICGDYVFACENDENVAIDVLYNFLSAPIDKVPANERNIRMRAITNEIEENINFKEDEKA